MIFIPQLDPPKDFIFPLVDKLYFLTTSFDSGYGFLPISTLIIYLRVIYIFNFSNQICTSIVTLINNIQLP